MTARCARLAGKIARGAAVPLALALPMAIAAGALAQSWDTSVQRGDPSLLRQPMLSRKARAPAPIVTRSIEPASASPAAEPAHEVTPTPAGEVKAAPRRREAPSFETAAAKQYCINIADAAADAKFAWQKKVLTELSEDLDKRREMLEAKTAEYQKWLARRDEFVKRAQETLVVIYARMKAESAAKQLAAMDEETAAAVIIKLDARVASAILNEMEPTQAARLTGTIAGAGRVAPGASAVPATPAAAPAGPAAAVPPGAPAAAAQEAKKS